MNKGYLNMLVLGLPTGLVPDEMRAAIDSGEVYTLSSG